MPITPELLRKIIEAALLAAAKPLTIHNLQQLFDGDESPSKDECLAAFEDIQSDCEDRGYELIEVAGGWRFQVRQTLAPWVSRLWEEKPQKYSRALLETLSLITILQYNIQLSSSFVLVHECTYVIFCNNCIYNLL